MRTIFTVCIVFLSIIGFAQQGEIAVQIKNLDPDKKGEVRIAIYNSSENFLEPGSESFWAVVKVKGNEVDYLFKNIPPGVYAIAVYQDYNSNNRLDKNLFGAPVEMYGFSNNVYGTFSAPSFESVSFKVQSGQKSILRIELNQP